MDALFSKHEAIKQVRDLWLAGLITYQECVSYVVLIGYVSLDSM